MEFNDKEIEYLERIVSADRRYIDNLRWLEKMNEENGIGQPAVVWAEAMLLADTIDDVEIFRDNTLERCGVTDKKLYAVRTMAIYILEDKEFSEIMVAECSAMNIIKIRTLKRVIKELTCISSELGLTSLTVMLALIEILNKDFCGELDDEVDMVFNLINNRKTEMVEVRKKIDEGKNVFSNEQVDASGILNHRRFWLEAMYCIAHGDYRLKSNIEASDEDLCVAFLVVLKYNNEYNDKMGYDVFFKMMRNLMKIDMSENEQSRIKRYIQINGVDYNNWKETPKKKSLRKKIAKDMVFAFNQRRNKLGFARE